MTHYFFLEIEHEELHLHTEVESIRSETDSGYGEADCSTFDDIFDPIDKIATEFYNVGLSIPSFIILLLLSPTAIAHKYCIHNDENDSTRENSLASNMITEFET